VASGVAILESNPILRRRLSQELSRHPRFRCVGAFATFASLLAEVERLAPRVVLVGLELQDASSVDATRRIKAILPDSQVLILAATEDEQELLEAFLAGACGYVWSRSSPERIVEAIADICEGGATVTGRFVQELVHKYLEKSRATAAVYRISPREQQILASLVAGMSYKMIADRCSISIDTVRSHIKHIYDKLNVHSRSEAIVLALKQKLV
jgi:DNA-binding NarL/FixJ family response regulator